MCMPIPYLHSFGTLKPRFDQLADSYSHGQVTLWEYASDFYSRFTDLSDWKSLERDDLNELLDQVWNLPTEVQTALRVIIEGRSIDGFAPRVALGLRMPENEQRERIPFVRLITEALLARLDSFPNNHHRTDSRV